MCKVWIDLVILVVGVTLLMLVTGLTGLMLHLCPRLRRPCHWDSADEELIVRQHVMSSAGLARGIPRRPGVQRCGAQTRRSAPGRRPAGRHGGRFFFHWANRWQQAGWHKLRCQGGHRGLQVQHAGQRDGAAQRSQQRAQLDARTIGPPAAADGPMTLMKAIDSRPAAQTLGWDTRSAKVDRICRRCVAPPDALPGCAYSCTAPEINTVLVLEARPWLRPRLTPNQRGWDWRLTVRSPAHRTSVLEGSRTRRP